MKHQDLLLPLALVSLAACAPRTQEPTVLSSAEQTSYVLSYPDEVTASTTALADDKTEAARVNSELKMRADALKGDVDPELLLQVVEKSEEAGKGRAFADARERELAVRKFFENERGPLTGRVNAAAQKQVSEASCAGQIDVGNSVGYALKDGIDKQLEKRLREHNDAHLLIDRHRAALGNANVAIVQKLADDIALASYLVNVALLRDKQRLERLIGERRSVESTLEDAIEAERTFQSEQAKSDAEKKASEQRIADLAKSKDAIPTAVQNAETASQGLEQEIQKADAEYETAISDLKKHIEARKTEGA